MTFSCVAVLFLLGALQVAWLLRTGPGELQAALAQEDLSVAISGSSSANRSGLFGYHCDNSQFGGDECYESVAPALRLRVMCSLMGPSGLSLQYGGCPEDYSCVEDKLIEGSWKYDAATLGMWFRSKPLASGQCESTVQEGQVQCCSDSLLGTIKLAHKGVPSLQIAKNKFVEATSTSNGDWIKPEELGPLLESLKVVSPGEEFHFTPAYLEDGKVTLGEFESWYEPLTKVSTNLPNKCSCTCDARSQKTCTDWTTGEQEGVKWVEARNLMNFQF